ncbi:hypothetical protein [Bacteroides sp.]|uniref:hypothetical protein n=1 Tax=Bacteroides sp. TaxID=29523 RepID=UPI0025C49EAE|nr:hypothetical protein [Bacteroides sp.]
MIKILILPLFLLLFWGCKNGTTSSVQKTTQREVLKHEIRDVPPILDESLINYDFSIGEVVLTFKDIKITSFSDETYALTLKVKIKNNSSETFFISDFSWKLTDSDMIEIEESGVYSPEYEDFLPGTFYYTTVAPGFGKVEEVGYHIKEKGAYYLCALGAIRFQIIL